MSKKQHQKNFSNLLIWIMVGLLGILLLAVTLLRILSLTGMQSAADIPSEATSETARSATQPIRIQVPGEVSIDLGRGLRITDVGSYTGVYMEDGSDDIVSDILMIVVKNESDEALQYAGITLTTGERTAEFAVSTLPAGESALLLEQSRQQYAAEEDYAAQAHEVVFFDAPLSLCEDQVELEALEGAINVTNVSGQDIEGDVVVYYKNRSADLYYGGITYRARIQGGLAAGEIKQIMTDHFSAAGCEVLFVTCG